MYGTSTSGFAFTAENKTITESGLKLNLQNVFWTRKTCAQIMIFDCELAVSMKVLELNPLAGCMNPSWVLSRDSGISSLTSLTDVHDRLIYCGCKCKVKVVPCETCWFHY